MRFFKVLMLCIAVPIIIVFLLCIVLPLMLVFILISAIFAPHRIKGTFQQVRTYGRPQPQNKADTGDIDVEYTVLESKEISSDS